MVIYIVPRNSWRLWTYLATQMAMQEVWSLSRVLHTGLQISIDLLLKHVVQRAVTGAPSVTHI